MRGSIIVNCFLTAIATALLTSSGSCQSGTDYARAEFAYQKGNYAQAAELFARAEAASPGTTSALIDQTRCLIHLEKFSSAERTLHAYLTVHPHSEDALYLLGFVLHRQDRPRESLETYTRAAALKPPTADDLKIVGLDYVLLKDYPDAIRWLERVVELDPKSKDGWYYLGRAYYSDSRASKARQAFLTVLELDPHDVKAESNLGLIFDAEGKPDDALEAYHNAIAWQQRNPRPSDQPLVNLGSLLLQQGHPEESIPYLEEAAAISPRNGYCHLKLGTAYLRLRRFREAQRELETATTLEPDDPAPHYQLGLLYKETHVLDRAQAEFDRFQELQARTTHPILAPSGN
jgi:tetratricopeptide (TPR) repeat protein